MTDVTIVGFYDEFVSYASTGTPYLLGNVGDHIDAVLLLNIHWESICKVETNGSTIKRFDGGSFIADGFRINDTFETINCGANDGTTWTIASITDAVIVITGTFTANATYNTGEIHGTTQITSLDYWYNINPSYNNLISMTDAGNKQKYVVDGIDATDVVNSFPFTPIGPSLAWSMYYYGNFVPQIVGAGVANFVQSFYIIHRTMIVPLSLANQQLNFENKIPPDYFKGDNCLTWAGSFTAKTTKTDPCSPHTSGNVFCNGNTGWYNENFNGMPSVYKVKSVIYDGGNNTAIDACNQTNIEINIESSSSNFTAGMKCRLFFHWFATPESSYQQTTSDLITNYHYDTSMLVDGFGPINGDYFGTDNQCIKGATMSVTSPNNIQILFDASFSTTFFKAGFKYVIGVIVQDPAVATTIDSDRTSVLCDFNTMICNLKSNDYSTLMQDVQFFQHPKSASAGTTDINGIVGDIWLAKAFIGIKKSASIVFNAMDVAIEAVNSVTGARFDLERKSYNLKQYIPDANYIQAIDIKETRNWQTWTEYDYITFKRCPSLDDANYAVYELNYPVRLMDETYRKLAAGGAYFQNPTNNWSQYSQNGDWDVQFNIYTEVQGQQVQYNLFTSEAIIRNYQEDGLNPAFDFDITSIDTIKAGTGINTNGVITSTGITLVKVNIAGDFTSFPVGFDGFYGTLGMCSVQTGSCDYSSTNLKTNANSVWLGIDPQNDPYIRLTITSNTTAVLESLLDASKLDKGVDPSTYYITARVGYQVTEQLLAQENQAYILQENGFGILIN